MASESPAARHVLLVQAECLAMEVVGPIPEGLGQNANAEPAMHATQLMRMEVAVIIFQDLPAQRIFFFSPLRLGLRGSRVRLTFSIW